jgi:hypothetical protein
MAVTCNLKLTQLDSRIPFPTAQQEYCFSKETVAKAHDVVCSYFDVEQYWDKELFRCILSDDVDSFSCFNLDRADNPHLTYGVSFEGDKSVFFGSTRSEIYVPDENKDQNISIIIRKFREDKTLSVKMDGEFSYDVLATGMDRIVVALFNNDSFIRLREADSGSLYRRQIEKITVAAPRVT